MRVNFVTLIDNLRIIKDTMRESNRHFTGEYIYHLISVLLESEKLINAEFFDPGYIQEHCITLYRYANQVSVEESRNANR
jgi:hypothetical protein